MNVSKALEADTQAPEVVQPTDGALDHPAGLAQAAAVRLTTTRDACRNALRVQLATLLVVIVAAVRLHERRLGQRAARFAANRRKGFDQRDQLRDVVAVGPGQDQRERDTLRFGDEVVLGARASAIGGIGSCF